MLNFQDFKVNFDTQFFVPKFVKSFDNFLAQKGPKLRNTKEFWHALVFVMGPGKTLQNRKTLKNS